VRLLRHAQTFARTNHVSPADEGGIVVRDTVAAPPFAQVNEKFLFNLI